MGVKERREREKQGLRQEILEAARDLFVAEGYENVSMRRIAEKIEYSPTTIYLYFKDKDELLEQVCEETFARFLADYQELEKRRPSDPVEFLRQGLRAYVHFGLANPNHYRVSFMMPSENRIHQDKYLQPDSMGMKSLMNLRRCVEECMRAGRFRKNDIDTVTQSLWAGAHGVTSLLIAHPHFPWMDREKLIGLVIDSAVDGLLKPKGAK